MKGIILAGGSGTRLYPITKIVNKQMLPIYGKPMIYYPISTLIKCGINEILIISGPNDICKYEELLEDGSQWGCSFTYEIQDEPNGIAEAFIIGKDFIGKDNVAIILGDNIFHGIDYKKIIKNINNNFKGGLIFGYEVNDPERYGVVSFDAKKNVIDIKEKPENPKSNYAVPGLYFYDNKVLEYINQITPSHRGELEITDINNCYLIDKTLKVHLLNEGVAWLDTGTIDAYQQACQYIQVIEERQGIIIGSPEESAFKLKFINKEQLSILISPLLKSGYGQKLKKLIKSK